MSKSKLWKYMSLERICHLPNNGRELLGKFIYWTEKRDGSCLAIWLKKNPRYKIIFNKILRKKYQIISLDYILMISSRNQEIAESDIKNDFLLTDDSCRVKEYLRDNPTHIVFGEILRLGISPTRIEKHDKVEFIVFDVFDGTRFLSYQQVHQFCFHYDMKCVELFGEGRFVTMESLLDYRDKMLEICKEQKREGVVLKTFYSNDKPFDNRPLYCKEKLDIATPRGHPKIEKGTPQYTPLPLSEARGAIDKVFCDLGIEFTNKAIAMPKVVNYIKEEMEKHKCGKPAMSLYALYCEYLENHNMTILNPLINKKTEKHSKKSLWNKIKSLIKQFKHRYIFR